MLPLYLVSVSSLSNNSSAGHPGERNTVNKHIVVSAEMTLLENQLSQNIFEDVVAQMVRHQTASGSGFESGVSRSKKIF